MPSPTPTLPRDIRPCLLVKKQNAHLSFLLQEDNSGIFSLPQMGADLGLERDEYASTYPATWGSSKRPKRPQTTARDGKFFKRELLMKPGETLSWDAKEKKAQVDINHTSEPNRNCDQPRILCAGQREITLVE